MTDATPGMMDLARKCAAKYWQTGDPGDEAAARSILSGAWDDQAYTQAALAAIIETQRLIVHSLRHDFDDWPDYVAIADVADAVERGQWQGDRESPNPSADSVRVARRPSL